MNDRLNKDKKQILAHVKTIFESFLQKDRASIKKLHSDDWVGFMGPSQGIERGIEAYLKHADSSLESFKGVGYEIIDYEIQIYGDIGIIYYVAKYEYENAAGDRETIPLRSIDVYRRTKNDWIQCGSHITVIPATESWVE